ncbi:MAG: beta-propeller domain-containing protein, partial [Candidatus Peregrinibacteria bacterium]|nr:beta-propeller domain-containing protein [Candidatus Peregrinibacteria bacterium]
NGFELRGRIAHFEDYYDTYDEYLDGEGWYADDIDRILYIGEALYTTSTGWVKAHDINTLEEQGVVELSY